MEKTNKKPYVKPGIVFENYVTGELSGSPEMIERILRETQEANLSEDVSACPFKDVSCVTQGALQ